MEGAPMTKEEMAKSGYEAALKFVDKEARTIWSVFTAMVGVNAFLAAMAGAVLKNGTLVTAALGAIGVVVCVVWAMMMRRNFSFYRYYFAYARKYEREAFGDVVDMTQKGKNFAAGNQVTINEGDVALSTGCFASVRAEWLIYLVISVFVAVYLYFVIAGWK